MDRVKDTKTNPRSTVVLSELLRWFALGALVGAGENLLALGWPATLGLAAAFVRFFSAPVADDICAHAAVVLIACVSALLYSVSVMDVPTTDVIFLAAGSRWSLALLALGYGVIGGIVLGLLFHRILGRSINQEVVNMLARADRTTFYINWHRKTNPAVTVFAIALTIVGLGFMRGWW